MSENEEIRNIALKSSTKIYKHSTDAAKKVIEKHAMLYLGFISLSTPPQELYGNRHASRPWSDDLYKMCLNLVMALFPEKEGEMIALTSLSSKHYCKLNKDFYFISTLFIISHAVMYIFFKSSLSMTLHNIFLRLSKYEIRSSVLW